MSSRLCGRGMVGELAAPASLPFDVKLTGRLVI